MYFNQLYKNLCNNYLLEIHEIHLNIFILQKSYSVYVFSDSLNVHVTKYSNIVLLSQFHLPCMLCKIIQICPINFLYPVRYIMWCWRLVLSIKKLKSDKIYGSVVKCHENIKYCKFMLITIV